MLGENTFAFKCREGLLLWGYHEAAVLGECELSATRTGVSVTATVVTADAFKSQQQPLTLRIRRPSGVVWTWPVESLDIVGQTLTARLGPQED